MSNSNRKTFLMKVGWHERLKLTIKRLGNRTERRPERAATRRVGQSRTKNTTQARHEAARSREQAVRERSERFEGPTSAKAIAKGLSTTAEKSLHPIDNIPARGLSMKFLLPLSVAAFACSLCAQMPVPQRPLTSRSTLVLVPAFVHEKNGEPVYTLSAADFVLTDNGKPQTLRLEEDSGDQPLALVIALEVGGAGTREYDKLGALVPMLEALLGGVPHRIAVVGFDSKPTLVQPFTDDVDAAKDALIALQPGCTRQGHIDNCAGPHPVHNASLGDNGAAILDSVALSERHAEDVAAD